MGPEVCAADVAGVFEGVVHIARIVEKLRAVGRPEHQLQLLAAEEVFPLPEDFPGGRGEAVVGHVEAERLQGDFQGYFFQ